MSRIAVAGPSTKVTDAALSVHDQGGSVVDAAIAAALTAMCTEPGVCGPGGGGFMTVDVPGHTPVVIDGYMAVPGIGFSGEVAIREVEMSYGGGMTTIVDAGSIAVPGAFAAFAQASEMFGRISWAKLMETIADHVVAFPLSFAAHLYLNSGADQIFRDDVAAKTALLDGEAPKKLGATVTFDGLADTLRRIGHEGPQTLYGGGLGVEITDDLLARGGGLTLDDLSSYRAAARQPNRVTLGEWSLEINPAPAVGGVVLGDVLIRRGDSTSSTSLARALTEAFEARREHSLGSPSTISIATADSDGGVVAASFSAGYGSGVIPAGTGMLMNNALGELELEPKDSWGGPGDRMISNMVPTVAKRSGATIALGSPGADRITSALAMTLNRLSAGDSLGEAVAHPRVHPEFGDFGVRMAAEPDIDLSGLDLPLRVFDERQMYFGGVNAAGVIDGVLVAEADQRRTGAVAFSDG